MEFGEHTFNTTDRFLEWFNILEGFDDRARVILQISKYIKSGGELIIESLVIDSKEHDILIPQGRYAKMKNVWSV